MPVKKKLGYRLSLALAPLLNRLILGTIFLTCRVTVLGGENPARFDKLGRPFILAIWHYGVLYGIQLYRGRKWVAIISASGDGEYISRILESGGVECVRGSRHHGGISALKGMVAAVGKRGRNAALVADGSQGPPRQVQAGAILLASKTGAPIIPVTWGADRYFRFRSWDRTIIPKPFARMTVKWGEPLEVPTGLKSDGVEEYRLRLEQRLNADYREIWAGFGKEEH